MTQLRTSERIAGAIEKARRQWQLQQKTAGPTSAVPEPPLDNVSTPTGPAFSIAISREAGANGSLVGRTVAERLGWAVYDRELVQHIANDLGVRRDLVDSVDEKSRSWIAESLEALLPPSTVNDFSLVRHLLQTLLSLSARGNCVFVGRGAAQLLPMATTLRVRLVSPIQDRVQTIRTRLGISPEEAKKWIEKTDRERNRFVKDHFQMDANDPTHYDLLLNSSRLGVSECADLIIEALRLLQAQSEKGQVPAHASGTLCQKER